MAIKKGAYSDTPSIRLGELAGPLLERAEEEGKKPARVIRDALRVYLLDSSFAGCEDLVTELKSYRLNLSKVGSNLNQLAYCFNVHDTVNEKELAEVHKDLYEFLTNISHILKKVIDEIEKE